MPISPSELSALAQARRREPWNWTSQFVALAFLCPTLFFHSSLALAATLIFFGVGFFRLELPAPPDNRWFRFVHRAIEWEKNWLAAPWSWYKSWRFGFVLLAATAVARALWTRDLAMLALIAGFGVLARVARENKKNGIDP